VAYSYGQLETLWTQAGGPKALAPLMAAIALAESSGNPGALNTTDNGGTQTSVGLWQVSTGTHQYPSAWATPEGNAKEAVAKYKSQGLGAWGTYTSGAYRQFYKGGTPASSLPQGGGTQQATLDSAGGIPGWLGGAFDIALGPLGIITGAEQEIGGAVTGGVGTAQSFEGIWKSLDTVTKEFAAVLTGVEWLFVPSHWVRIIAFVFGIGFGIPGLHDLSKSGQGDMSLAIGILLTVLSGLCFFVAFHNLPDDITSFSDLLQWESDALRKNAPKPAAGETVTA
jgi:hypothetical protein